jgi:Zn-dependent protease with chaperone function
MPSLAGRALIGLSLLVGFYVLAALIVVGVIGMNVGIAAATGRLPAGVVFASALILLAVGRSVFYVEREDPDADGGVEVADDEEPALWALVRETAEAVGTRAPDAVRLVHDVNASVEERGGMLGLLPGRRVLRVGVALLQVLDAEELRSVLAHEMGHYAGGDTALGAVSYRGSESLRRTVDNLGERTLLGRLFAAYAALYQRVTLGVRRRQELQADLAAVRSAGPQAHAGALRKVTAAAAAYDFYLDRYVAPLWDEAATPADLYGGYRQLLAEPRRQEEMAQVLAAALAADADPYDSHPSLAQRLGALGADGASSAVAPGSPVDHPARAVLRDPAEVERRVAAALTRRATRGAEVRPVAWEEAGPVLGAPTQRTAYELAAFVGRLEGHDAPAPLDVVLERCRGGADSPLAGPLAAALVGDLDHLPAEEQVRARVDLLAGELADAVGGALVAQGAASWQLHWGQPLELVGAAGPIALHDEVRAAVERDDVDGLRARLDAMGLDRSWVPQRPAAPTAAAPALLGVLSDVGAHRRRHDLVLLEDRFALVRVRLTPLDAVTVGLSAGVGGSIRGDGPAVRRWEHIQRTALDELLAADAGNVARAWADVADAELRKRLGGWVLRLTFTDGEVLRVKSLATAAPHDAVAEALGRVLGPTLRTGSRSSLATAA